MISCLLIINSCSKCIVLIEPDLQNSVRHSFSILLKSSCIKNFNTFVDKSIVTHPSFHENSPLISTFPTKNKYFNV